MIGWHLGWVLGFGRGREEPRVAEDWWSWEVRRRRVVGSWHSVVMLRMAFVSETFDDQLPGPPLPPTRNPAPPKDPAPAHPLNPTHQHRDVAEIRHPRHRLQEPKPLDRPVVVGHVQEHAEPQVDGLDHERGLHPGPRRLARVLPVPHALVVQLDAPQLLADLAALGGEAAGLGVKDLPLVVGWVVVGWLLGFGLGLR